MTISYRFRREESICIGLPVEQLLTNNGSEPQLYILIPYIKEQYCEVEIIYSQDFEWASSYDGNTNLDFNTKPVDEYFDLDEEITQSLCCVWDDGALRHPDDALKLYLHFKSMIDQNQELALNVKSRIFENQYRQKIIEAKEKGWDINLIKLRLAQQPYGSD